MQESHHRILRSVGRAGASVIVWFLVIIVSLFFARTVGGAIFCHSPFWLISPALLFSALGFSPAWIPYAILLMLYLGVIVRLSGPTRRGARSWLRLLGCSAGGGVLYACFTWALVAFWPVPKLHATPSDSDLEGAEDRLCREAKELIKGNPLPASQALDPNVGGPFGRTLLMEACYSGLDIPGHLEAMIRNGGDLGATDEGGTTPLMFAVYGGQLSVVTVLLEHGADVNQVCNEDHTVLHTAIGRDAFDMVLLLLEHGADPNMCWSGAVYPNRLSPLTSAVLQEEDRVVEALVEHGADVNFANRRGRPRSMRPLNTVGSISFATSSSTGQTPTFFPDPVA